jgi:O-antigen/teichoic acid export membrane protein
VNLRRQTLAGGRQLLVREAMGIVLRTAGILVVTALIGPTAYGLFAGPFIAVTFLSGLAITGIDVFLIRRAGELDEDWYHQAFSYLVVSSLAVTGLGLLAAGMFATQFDDVRFIAPLQVLLLSIPINITWIPARARLERDMRFKRMAMCELGADALQYLAAITLALLGWGLWAPVYGFLVRQAFLLGSSYLLARYRPRWHWERHRVREMLHFGAGMTATSVTRRLNDLVLPVLLGATLGAAAVGIAALTVRLCDTIAFVNRATHRLSLVVLGKLQQEPARLRAAADKAMVLQVMAVGGLFGGFSVVGAPLVPVLLGEEWRPVITLFPVVALSYLLVAIIGVQTANLLVFGRHRAMMLGNLAALALHALGGLILVPALGLLGYGLARLLSSVGYWVRYREIRRLGGISLRRAWPWLACVVPLLFVPVLPWPAAAACFLPAAGVMLARRPRAELRTMLRLLLGRGSSLATPATASGGGFGGTSP